MADLSRHLFIHLPLSSANIQANKELDLLTRLTVGTHFYRGSYVAVPYEFLNLGVPENAFLRELEHRGNLHIYSYFGSTILSFNEYSWCNTDLLVQFERDVLRPYIAKTGRQHPIYKNPLTYSDSCNTFIGNTFIGNMTEAVKVTEKERGKDILEAIAGSDTDDKLNTNLYKVQLIKLNQNE